MQYVQDSFDAGCVVAAWLSPATLGQLEPVLRRLMAGRHPLQDLAPRDIVARANQQSQSVSALAVPGGTRRIDVHQHFISPSFHALLNSKNSPTAPVFTRDQMRSRFESMPGTQAQPDSVVM